MRKYHQADRLEEDQGADNSLLSPGRRDEPRRKIRHSTEDNMGFPQPVCIPGTWRKGSIREKDEKCFDFVLKFESQV